MNPIPKAKNDRIISIGFFANLGMMNAVDSGRHEEIIHSSLKTKRQMKITVMKVDSYLKHELVDY